SSPVKNSRLMNNLLSHSWKTITLKLHDRSLNLNSNTAVGNCYWCNAHRRSHNYGPSAFIDHYPCIGIGLNGEFLNLGNKAHNVIPICHGHINFNRGLIQSSSSLTAIDLVYHIGKTSCRG